MARQRFLYRLIVNGNRLQFATGCLISNGDFMRELKGYIRCHTRRNFWVNFTFRPVQKGFPVPAMIYPNHRPNFRPDKAPMIYPDDVNHSIGDWTPDSLETFMRPIKNYIDLQSLTIATLVHNLSYAYDLHNSIGMVTHDPISRYFPENDFGKVMTEFFGSMLECPAITKKTTGTNLLALNSLRSNPILRNLLIEAIRDNPEESHTLIYSRPLRYSRLDDQTPAGLTKYPDLPETVASMVQNWSEYDCFWNWYIARWLEG